MNILDDIDAFVMSFTFDKESVRENRKGQDDKQGRVLFYQYT